MRARRLAVLLLLPALPLGAAACGGGKKSSTNVNSGTPADAVKSAAGNTAKAGTMQMTLTAVSAGGTRVAVAGTGGFDTSSSRGELHLRFSTSGISSTIDSVIDGTDVYLRSPLFSLVLPTGKSWVKIDLTKAGKVGGVDLSSLLSEDPTQALDALQKNLTGATKVGTAQVRGVSATHYKATVAKSARTKAGVYDVWVGDDGYIHRMRTTVAGTGSTAGAVTATSNLFNFGKPVTVTVPPASQTVDSTNGSIPGLGG